MAFLEVKGLPSLWAGLCPQHWAQHAAAGCSHLSEKVLLPQETYTLSWIQTGAGAATPLSPGTHSFSNSPCPWVVHQQVRGFHFQLATATKSSHRTGTIASTGNSWFCPFGQMFVFSPSGAFSPRSEFALSLQPRAVIPAASTMPHVFRYTLSVLWAETPGLGVPAAHLAALPLCLPATTRSLNSSPMNL